MKRYKRIYPEDVRVKDDQTFDSEVADGEEDANA